MQNEGRDCLDKKDRTRWVVTKLLDFDWLDKIPLRISLWELKLEGKSPINKWVSHILNSSNRLFNYAGIFVNK